VSTLSQTVDRVDAAWRSQWQCLPALPLPDAMPAGAATTRSASGHLPGPARSCSKVCRA